MPTTSTMAARRSLGGGRVLGSGPSPSPALHRRHPSLLSPSESSLSLSSHTSHSPASTADARDDIGSKVRLAPSDHAAAATASSRLVCPICNEDMVRHRRLPQPAAAPHCHRCRWTLTRPHRSPSCS